jgi:hypothetical protein
LTQGKKERKKKAGQGPEPIDGEHEKMEYSPDPYKAVIGTFKMSSYALNDEDRAAF